MGLDVVAGCHDDDALATTAFVQPALLAWTSRRSTSSKPKASPCSAWPVTPSVSSRRS